jgi:hypothetical protein
VSTLAPVEPPQEALDGQEPCSPGCLLCTTSRTPMKAYRPHTLDDDCWCTYGADGEKSHRPMCWVYKTYLSTRET